MADKKKIVATDELDYYTQQVHQEMTEAEYNNLTKPLSKTLYFITDKKYFIFDGIKYNHDSIDTKNPVFTGTFSHNRKEGTTIGEDSVALGHNATASGMWSFAEGNNTISAEDATHAEGNNTHAYGGYSHTEGTDTETSVEGICGHAEGEGSKVTARNAHAEGFYTIANGESSHTEGQQTEAHARGAHAEGIGTEAHSAGMHSAGKYNKTMSGVARVTGWGEGNAQRKDIEVLDTNGNVEFAGIVQGSVLRAMRARTDKEGKPVNARVDVSDYGIEYIEEHEDGTTEGMTLSFPKIEGYDTFATQKTSASNLKLTSTSDGESGRTVNYTYENDNYTIRLIDANNNIIGDTKTIPNSRYSYGSMISPTAEKDGKGGLVPQPKIGDENKVLFGNGTWGEVESSRGTQTVKVGDTSYSQIDGVVSLPAYPTTLPASDVKAWAKADNKPTYTASEVGALASTTTHLSGDIATSQKGTANGVASLDANGKVPSSQLPSYVDDVLEYDNKASFPSTGETGKIYVDKATNLTWRWSGSAYVEISPSLALGETSSTAYAGDKGKAVADSLTTHKADTTVHVTSTEKSTWNNKMDKTTVLTGGSQTSSSSADGGSNVYTFTKSDGTTSTLTVKNGSKGSQGDPGATGKSIDSVSLKSTSGKTKTYSVKTGTTEVGTFSVTDGSDGASGAAATISIGTVTTGAAGTSVSITNVGTTSAAKFNFTIPKGDKGDKGDPGQNATTTDVVSTSANGLAPKVTDTSKFLKGDGTWATPTNTTYESKSAASGGTDVSLVTTGEKYNWNNKVDKTEAGVNAAINLLSTGTSDPKDDDYYISQYVGGGTTTTTYHRRPIKALWNYIKGKIDAAGYGIVANNLTTTTAGKALDATQGKALKDAHNAIKTFDKKITLTVSAGNPQTDTLTIDSGYTIIGVFTQSVNTASSLFNINSWSQSGTTVTVTTVGTQKASFTLSFLGIKKV